MSVGVLRFVILGLHATGEVILGPQAMPEVIPDPRATDVVTLTVLIFIPLPPGAEDTQGMFLMLYLVYCFAD